MSTNVAMKMETAVISVKITLEVTNVFVQKDIFLTLNMILVPKTTASVMISMNANTKTEIVAIYAKIQLMATNVFALKDIF